MTRRRFLLALARALSRARQPGGAAYLRGALHVGGDAAGRLRAVLAELTRGERDALPALWRRAVERRMGA